MIKKYIIYIALLCFAVSQAFPLPNDVRWVTNSSEYKILCKQIYEHAWWKINSNPILEQSQWAIVMDLDETVLDNSQYQINLSKKNESYNPDSWSKWVNLEQADLVPGAKIFIDKIRSFDNIQLIFLSNRMAKNLAPTIQNMKALGIYDEQDIFLLRENKQDKKYIRRNEIMLGTGRMQNTGPMKILSYFGDARHDFPDEDNIYRFGENMFMFPNPMYGKW